MTTKTITIATIIAIGIAIITITSCRKQDEIANGVSNTEFNSKKPARNGEAGRSNSPILFPSDEQARRQLVEFDKLLNGETTPAQYGSKDIEIANWLLEGTANSKYAVHDTAFGDIKIDTLIVALDMLNGEVTPQGLITAWGQMKTFINNHLSDDGTVLGLCPTLVAVDGEPILNTNSLSVKVVCGKRDDRIAPCRFYYDMADGQNGGRCIDGVPEHPVPDPLNWFGGQNDAAGELERLINRYLSGGCDFNQLGRGFGPCPINPPCCVTGQRMGPDISGISFDVLTNLPPIKLPTKPDSTYYTNNRDFSVYRRCVDTSGHDIRCITAADMNYYLEKMIKLAFDNAPQGLRPKAVNVTFDYICTPECHCDTTCLNCCCRVHRYAVFYGRCM